LSLGSANLRFFVSDALGTIRENLATAVLTAVTLAFSLAICAFFFIVFVNMGSLFSSWGSNAYIVAYVKDPPPKAGAVKLGRQIKRIKGVSNVRYISKSAAMAELRKGLRGHAGILEGMDKDILPASFEVSLSPEAREPAKMLEVVKRIKALSWVDEVQYSQEWARKFYGVFRFFELTAIVVGVVLAAAAVFVITNTIRLTVYARREEIEVLRLVGASDNFISMPFLIEGIIEGAAGGVLASIIVFAVIFVLRYNIPAYLAFILDVPAPVYVVFIITTIIGILSGALGSIISTGRFLRA